MSKKKWAPLESNVKTLNEYLKNFGVEGKFGFCDIYGFGDELSWVPQPAIGVLLVFPITEKNEKFRQEEEEKLIKENKISKNVWYIKQTIGNACGTIGLLHAVYNNLDNFTLKGAAKELYDKTIKMNPDERAKYLETFNAIEEVHTKTAKSKNNVKLKKEDFKTWKHFISFVQVDGHLYELDGRSKGPKNRGKTSQKSFLKDVAKVIKHLIKISPEKPYDFAAISLSKV